MRMSSETFFVSLVEIRCSGVWTESESPDRGSLAGNLAIVAIIT